MTTTIDLDTIRAHVERGAAVMDAQRPGWAELIDKDTFNIGDCAACVLGQSYENDTAYDEGFDNPFEAGAFELFGDAYGFDNNAPVLIEHGFSAPAGAEEVFAALDDEWLRVINERRTVR
ncbi:hypothetical protein FAF44_02770 [Nonomuraea sp. MG754425]|uniref:hypothetical protein n=1 Tax=Nonomuraea sp. MG754425 TaxID=2570319 RepID=UPI001F1968DC|nr:hypothetical protein [Nonomuraea sp. MG754425]MCF6467337.1 hypothetical protein [Nonomuraea sp. MG754425]